MLSPASARACVLLLLFEAAMSMSEPKVPDRSPAVDSVDTYVRRFVSKYVHIHAYARAEGARGIPRRPIESFDT